MIFENWNARTLIAVVSGEQHGICIHQSSSQHLSLRQLLPVHVLAELRWGTMMEAGLQSLQRAFGGNAASQPREQKVSHHLLLSAGFHQQCQHFHSVWTSALDALSPCIAHRSTASHTRFLFDIPLREKHSCLYAMVVLTRQMCSNEGTRESSEARRWTDLGLSFSLAPF